MLPLSKTKDLNTDNNRQICSRSSADQNWQRRAASYNAHKALNDGNREIGKPNMVPCHHPSLPPSVSQQMLCSMKTLSAAQEWPEICWQWRWGPEDKKRRKKQKNVVKVSIWVNNDDTEPRRRAACKCMHRPLSRNRTYRYGNTPLPLPLPFTITIVYTYTHALVSCRPGAVWAQMVVNCITHLSVSGL